MDQMDKDPNYELNRIKDGARFYKKMRLKRLTYKLFGEVYIGRRVKFAYFREWLTRLVLPQSPVILEVGSGDGVYCFFLAQSWNNASVTGLELNPTEANVCQIIAEQERTRNLRFVSSVLSDHNWQNKFDFVYCLDVLEHIDDDISVMREMHAALKPGGYLLVHVPNDTYLKTDGMLIRVPDAEAYKINAGHVRHGYSPENLRSKLEQAGFQVNEIRPTQGRPIARAFKLYHLVEKVLALRIAILPIIDIFIAQDSVRLPVHGNTLWALAEKPR